MTKATFLALFLISCFSLISSVRLNSRSEHSRPRAHHWIMASERRIGYPRTTRIKFLQNITSKPHRFLLQLKNKVLNMDEPTENKSIDKFIDAFAFSFTFGLIDQNEDDYLTREELLNAARTYGDDKESTTEEEIDLLIKLLDTDGDGRISWDEYQLLNN